MSLTNKLLHSRVELFDGKGGLVEAIITFLGRSEVQLMALEPPHRTEMDVNQWKVAVACGSLKGGRADWLVEKCTVRFFFPLICFRKPQFLGKFGLLTFCKLIL